MHSSPIALFDSHIHLDDVNFQNNLTELLAIARHNHVEGWIIPGTVTSNFAKIQSITEQHQGCYAAYGLHPYFTNHTDDDLFILQQTLENHTAVAIGECGLDAMIPNPDLDKQLKLFKAHIRLALEFDLPLIIHARKTIDLVLKEIRKHPTLRGVLHSFSGSLQQAEIALAHNFLLGFGGAATFSRAQKLHSIIRTIPLGGLLIETDAPFQRGAYRDHGINYPADLLEIAKNIAVLREDSLESIAHATMMNTQKLFQLKGIE